MYALGQEAEYVFGSYQFAMVEDGEKYFELVLRKFIEYFIPKRSVIHERAQFHQRSQQSGEPLQSIVRCPYEMAEH